MRILEQENVKEFIAFLSDPQQIEDEVYHLHDGNYGEDIYKQWQRVKQGQHQLQQLFLIVQPHHLHQLYKQE